MRASSPVVITGPSNVAMVQAIDGSMDLKCERPDGDFPRDSSSGFKQEGRGQGVEIAWRVQGRVFVVWLPCVTAVNHGNVWSSYARVNLRKGG